MTGRRKFGLVIDAFQYGRCRPMARIAYWSDRLIMHLTGHGQHPRAGRSLPGRSLQAVDPHEQTPRQVSQDQLDIWESN